MTVKPADSQPAAATPAAHYAESKCPADDPLLICGKQNEDGSWPRKACSEFTTEGLRSKIATYEKKQLTWDKKWAAKNEAELKAMKAWLAYREIAEPETKAKISDEVPF